MRVQQRRRKREEDRRWRRNRRNRRGRADSILLRFRVVRLRYRNLTHFHIISSPSQSDARRRDAMTSLIRASPTNVSRQRWELMNETLFTTESTNTVLVKERKHRFASTQTQKRTRILVSKHPGPIGSGLVRQSEAASVHQSSACVW